MPPVAEIVVALLLLGSGGVVLVPALGLWRLPDFFLRMHAPTLASTLGAWIVAFASIVHVGTRGEGLALQVWLIISVLSITAPVTTSVLARAALFRRRRAGHPLPAPSLLVRCTGKQECNTPTPQCDLPAQKAADARHALQQVAMEITGAYDVVPKIDVVVVVGDPCESLLRASEHADLVVLGWRRRSRLSGLLIGRTADRLLRACERPILCVRAPVERPYQRVLVPIDFSASSDAAIQVAARIRREVSMHVFHVMRISSTALRAKRSWASGYRWFARLFKRPAGYQSVIDALVADGQVRGAVDVDAVLRMGGSLQAGGRIRSWIDPQLQRRVMRPPWHHDGAVAVEAAPRAGCRRALDRLAQARLDRGVPSEDRRPRRRHRRGADPVRCNPRDADRRAGASGDLWVDAQRSRRSLHTARGATLQEDAALQRLSLNTVRKHLKHALDKTGVHRQSQLVGLIASLHVQRPTWCCVARSSCLAGTAP